MLNLDESKISRMMRNQTIDLSVSTSLEYSWYIDGEIFQFDMIERWPLEWQIESKSIPRIQGFSY